MVDACDTGKGKGRMNLRRSLSIKKGCKPSIFASFTVKDSCNKLPANSCHPTRVSELPCAADGKLKASNSSASLNKLDINEEDVDLAAIGAAEMARLLEYDSQDEDFGDGITSDDDESPDRAQDFEDCPRRRSSCENYSRASTTCIDESESGEGGELDSVTLLNRLGDNPTESEMARVALARAQESIADTFSIGVDRAKFNEVPSYMKDELLLGQHLGKGSFSDVFEVTVRVRDVPVPVPSEGTSNLDKSLVQAAIQTTRSQKPENESLLRNSLAPEANGRRKSSQRRNSMCSSVCGGSLGRHETELERQGKRKTLAMKCLRPSSRSNFEHFLVGVEDLVHETAILSFLEHPNIIKLWGRAGDSNSLKLSDGYFILIDRLRDTLQDKIDRWAKTYPSARKNPPSLNQIQVACALSDALSYLHKSSVVFRDLKPANVGFDSGGTLKLFDFGFATRITTEVTDEPQPLRGKCGTLRYMAAEVGLGKKYGKEVDVYSFGILLWEICAVKKPFSNVKSAEDFEKKVFMQGERPKIGKYWPEYIKNTLQTCWSSNPSERPTMQSVKSTLTAAAHDLKTLSTQNFDSSSSLKKSLLVTKRLTWNI